jgi:hypothetical protein
MIYLSITKVVSLRDKFKQSLVISAIILTSILYITAVLDALPKIKFQKELLNFRTKHWLAHNHGLFFYEPSEANRTMVSSIQSGIYNLPPTHSSRFQKFLFSTNFKQNNLPKYGKLKNIRRFQWVRGQTSKWLTFFSFGRGCKKS